MHLSPKIFLIVFSIPPLLISCGSSPYVEGVPKTEVVDGSRIEDSLTVIAGPEYQAGGLHRFFFGDHYRDAWTAPTRVKVLDLESFAGGLTPTEAGGGFQTKSLRFAAADGRIFKFRSAEKNPRAVLPLELRGTVAGDLAQDHISTSHPAASLIVDELAPSVGVLSLDAELIYLPDNERLGDFREEFGGLLGVLELYPTELPESARSLVPERLRATKFRNTMKMYKGMEDDSEDRPDPIAFLRARFLDVFVGDWDRHVKQWKWAQFKEKGNKVWYPVPMDRDQAMVNLDGLFPSIAAMSISQFTDFREEVPDIYKLTFSGQYLDRRLLVSINRDTWDSTAAVFAGELTDELIERSVRRLPPEHYELDGERIERYLKSRRDVFTKTASEYYSMLAAYVDVHLSKKREVVEIERLDENRVAVTAWLRDKETGKARTDRQVFHRVFDRGDTKEVRIYLHGGDDHVIVAGEVPSSVLTRVIGGKGDDEMVNTSRVDGMLWGFIPFISTAEEMTFFYDHQGENSFSVVPGTVVDERPYKNPPGGIFQY